VAEYSQKLADIETPTGASKVERRSKGFREVDNIEIQNLADQPQIQAREIRTSITRGTQTIMGKQEVKDRFGNVAMIMGYSPGAF